MWRWYLPCGCGSAKDSIPLFACCSHPRHFSARTGGQAQEGWSSSGAEGWVDYCLGSPLYQRRTCTSGYCSWQTCTA